ncbi:unnamed protein product [Larinioides sclopetarius]|uniref:Uncharacterized protein n=1 Tax=Larinioides sclopetarius TaxID=280406 RepID=A0AAV2B0N6_9ARAC
MQHNPSLSQIHFLSLSASHEPQNEGNELLLTFIPRWHVTALGRMQMIWESRSLPHGGKSISSSALLRQFNQHIQFFGHTRSNRIPFLIWKRQNRSRAESRAVTGPSKTHKAVRPRCTIPKRLSLTLSAIQGHSPEACVSAGHALALVPRDVNINAQTIFFFCWEFQKEKIGVLRDCKIMIACADVLEACPIFHITKIYSPQSHLDSPQYQLEIFLKE